MKVQGLPKDGCRGTFYWDEEGFWGVRLRMRSQGKRRIISPSEMFGSSHSFVEQLRAANGPMVLGVVFDGNDARIMILKSDTTLEEQARFLTRVAARHYRQHLGFRIKWNWDIGGT